jgi:hypothetical protein
MIRSFDAIADDFNCSVDEIKRLVRKHNLSFLQLGSRRSMNQEQYEQFMQAVTTKYKTM